MPRRTHVRILYAVQMPTWAMRSQLRWGTIRAKLLAFQLFFLGVTARVETTTYRASPFPLQSMPVFAPGTRREQCAECFRTISAHDIGAMRNRFEMLRIHARSITTKMINLSPYWDRSLIPLVRKSVGQSGAPLHIKRTVASGIIRSLPHPTACRDINQKFSSKPFKVILGV